MTALFHSSALRGLLTDYRMTARMLIAVPVLVVGQTLMESRFRLIVAHLREAGLLKPAGLGQLDSVLASILRWRDSIWPELALVVAVYASVAVVFSSHLHEPRPGPWRGRGQPICCPPDGITLS